MTDATPPDLTASVHKALRCFMFEVLAAVGRVDVSDDDDVRHAVQQVQRLLALVREPQGMLALPLAQLQRGSLAQRAAAARELYLALSDWTVGMLQRLALEAARHAARPALPGAAAAAQRRHQLASLGDAELREALHWLGRALTPQELALLLDDLQHTGDGRRYGLARQALGEVLDGPCRNRLARAMGAPRPALPLAA